VIGLYLLYMNIKIVQECKFAKKAFIKHVHLAIVVFSFHASCIRGMIYVVSNRFLWYQHGWKQWSCA